MKIAIKLAFDEKAAVRLLNWLARENAIILQSRPDLPRLYDSGVVYRREQDETWCDYLNMLAQGQEDCDGLAAARAGELLAFGWRALSPRDAGYTEAKRARLATIPAEVLLLTTSSGHSPGQYHCIVRYRVKRRWHRDDPSARLGMPVPGSTNPPTRSRRNA